MQPKMTAEKINAFLADVFGQVSGQYVCDAVAEDSVVFRLKVDHSHLRPGGTVSGPSMFGLADVAMYGVVLCQIGPKALAVTTNCSIDFMRKPEGDRDLIAHAKLLKLGRSLVVGDVMITSEGSDKLVARASLTYAIPPKGSAADMHG